MADLGVDFSYSNLIHWGNNTINWNPDCTRCTSGSLGEGCNLPNLDDSAFWICSKDIFEREDLVVKCMGCKNPVESYADAFKLINPYIGTNSVKWLHHSCFHKVEMGIYICSKFYF